MKNVPNKIKIIILLALIIIIAGVIIIATTGFEFALEYEKTNKIELYIENKFAENDIKAITDETIPDKEVLIQTVEIYEDSVSIIAEEITEEEKVNTINKVNEKYGLEITGESVVIENIPHTRGRDILKPYIVPFAISAILVLAYMIIRYRKQNMLKVGIITTITIILVQVILFCIMAIVQFPIGNLTAPLVLIAYITTILALTFKFEKKAKQEVEESK